MRDQDAPEFGDDHRYSRKFKVLKSYEGCIRIGAPKREGKYTKKRKLSAKERKQRK
jgi:hypothetical protein